MSINFTSVTVTNGSDRVAINTSIDLTAIQYGWELQVVGAPLMLSIASGGQNVITLQEPYTATGTLTNVAAKIIETKAALSAALDNVTLFGNEMINTKNANQAIVDALGTAANADVTTSVIDKTIGRLLRVGDSGLVVGLGGGDGDPSDLTNGFGVTSFGDVHSNPWLNGERAAAITAVGVGAALQIAGSRTSGKLWFQFASGALTGDWRELFHSGNSINPLDYGIGRAGPTIVDVLAPLANGMYSGFGTNGLNYPSGLRFGNFINMVRDNNTNVHTRLYLGTNNDTVSASFSVSTDGGNTFDNEEAYHSGNTNFEVFGGEGGGTRPIAQAVALSPTTAVAYFHTVSFALPTGITLSAGSTFQLRQPDNTLLSTGLTNLTIDSFSGGRLVKVIISGASGLTKDEPLDLLKGASSDQIKVNF
jgi:hypothetical protein